MEPNDVADALQAWAQAGAVQRFRDHVAPAVRRAFEVSAPAYAENGAPSDVEADLDRFAEDEWGDDAVEVARFESNDDLIDSVRAHAAVGGPGPALWIAATNADARWQHALRADLGLRSVLPGPAGYVTTLVVDRPEQARVLLEGLRRSFPELFDA